MSEQSLKWLRAAGIRAIRTMAQTALAMLPVGISIQEVGWGTLLGTALLAGLYSLITSLAGLPELKGD